MRDPPPAPSPEPVALNRHERKIFYDDGVCRPFVNMFDRDGDETDDPAEAVAVVVMIDEHHWNAIDLRMFDETGGGRN